jgi:lipoyl(octanoyl) transferase
MTATAVRIFCPGLIDYSAALLWQREASAALREGRGPECLALLQHPPVYTLGRRTNPDHLLVEPATLRRRGAGVIAADRGGDVTFHGPGQLVGYPILDLRRRGILPGDYVRMLEATLIETLATFGIEAARVAGRPGVWAGGAKIAAIGIRVQGGVTTHGFALNVCPDLRWFDAIVPCGLADAGVTSMELLLGNSPGLVEVEDATIDFFARRFGFESARAAVPAPAITMGSREAAVVGH